MSIQVQNIIDQTRPLNFHPTLQTQIKPSLATPSREQLPTFLQNSREEGSSITSTADRRLFSSVQEIGQNVINYLKELVSSDAPRSGQSVSSQPNPLAVKAELSKLAESYSSTPQEGARFKSAINELFQSFGSAQNAQEVTKNSALLQKLESLGISEQTAVQGLKIIGVWDQLSSTQKISSAGQIGISVLEELGVFNKERANDFRGVAGALAVLSNKEVSARDKTIVAAQALAGLGTTSFTGSATAPTSIGGVPVVGSVVGADGTDSFLLVDGSTVSRSDIRTSQNVQSAIQALTILTSNAETEDKISALASVGIQTGQANGLISDVNAGRLGAALSVFNTVTNWDEMNNAQRVTATIQTADTVISALSGSAAESTGTSVGTSIGGALLSAVGAVAGLYTGIEGAKDTYDAVTKLPRSQAVKVGAIGGAASGAAIGAGSAVIGAAIVGAEIGSVVPIAGTIIGAVIGAGVGALMGAFGGGKSSAQKGRDSWRNVLEQSGFAKKIEGSHHVSLADGSTYNIGKDGGHKLTNVDGSERRTVDVDWGNPLAANNIDAAHVYAIATGLDPLENDKFWLFHGGAVQGLNAATSNASDQEQVMANFKTMIEQGGVAPESIALKIEVLRVSNKISDHDYAVYLHAINKIFKTEIAPSDRAAAHQAIVQQLASAPELGKVELELLQTLTDPTKYQESLHRLNDKEERDKEIREQDI